MTVELARKATAFQDVLHQLQSHATPVSVQFVALVTHAVPASDDWRMSQIEQRRHPDVSSNSRRALLLFCSAEHKPKMELL